MCSVRSKIINAKLRESGGEADGSGAWPRPLTFSRLSGVVHAVALMFPAAPTHRLNLREKGDSLSWNILSALKC